MALPSAAAALVRTYPAHAGGRMSIFVRTLAYSGNQRFEVSKSCIWANVCAMAQQIQVSIDRNSPVPLYHQLAEQLAAAVDTGVLKPGDAFENELSLADRLELSRPTVRRAIVELVTRGLLVRRRGIGTTVANEVIHRRNELTSLYDDLRREGREPITRGAGVQHRLRRPPGVPGARARSRDEAGLPRAVALGAGRADGRPAQLAGAVMGRPRTSRTSRPRASTTR